MLISNTFYILLFKIAGVKKKLGKKYVRLFPSERKRRMKLVFVRHGEGEHTKDLPLSLQAVNPPLTGVGKKQAKLLQCDVPLQEKDILIASPTLRTLQTAAIWSAAVACQKIVHPYIPAYFPLSGIRQNIAVRSIVRSKGNKKIYFHIFH